MNAAGHAGSRRLRILLLASVTAACAAALPRPGQAGVRQIPVPPPPMGWSSWNVFADAINETNIEGQADALKTLNAQLSPGTAPYTHLNIDEGWWIGRNGRDSTGAPVIDASAWTGGSMMPVAAHIHADGLLAGIYTDAGHTGCGDGAGSEGYYPADMLRFSQWGFDYVKVDYCGAQAENLDPQQTYTQVALALKNAEAETARSMYLSLCDWGLYAPSGYADSNQGPWTWAAGVGFLPADIWRTSEDLTFVVGSSAYANFEDVLQNFHSGIHPEAQHTGYHNDPDMMVIGVNGVDNDPSVPVQSQAHMDLWSVAGAPLILGTDVNQLLQQPALRAIVSNPHVIAIDQDARGLGAIEIGAPAPGLEVWARLLSSAGRRAVVLLNTTAMPTTMAVRAADLGLSTLQPVVSTDVWSNAKSRHQDGIVRAVVPAQGARMLLVAGSDLAPTAVPVTSAGGNTQTASLPASLGDSAAPINQGPTPLDITYRNGTGQTQFDMMSVNGGTPTVVAFPRTGGVDGTVSVIVDLDQGVANTVSFQSTTTQPVPAISEVAVVAGPVPVFQPAYPADAPGNTLSGTALVQTRSACTDGHDVGYVGSGFGASGSLTVNNVMAPKAGLFHILVAYLNGDSYDRQATITVNGQPGGSAAFPRGKDWNTVLVTPIAVQLQQGANSIAFSNASAYAPNFSALGAPK